MEMAFVIAIIGALVYIIFFSDVGKDYSKKTDLELIQLIGLHKNNVAAASKLGHKQHVAALQRMSALMNEMKSRGLVKQDTIPADPALQLVLGQLAQKQFSKSLNEIKDLATNNDPEALYQLAMIFHVAKEADTSLHYMKKSAESGYADAQYALGWTFLQNNGAKDMEDGAFLALKWFLIALEQGHAEAGKAVDVARKAVPETTFNIALHDAKKWHAEYIRKDVSSS